MTTIPEDIMTVTSQDLAERFGYPEDIKATADTISDYALFYGNTPEEAGSAKKTAYNLIARALLAEREEAYAKGLEDAAKVARSFDKSLMSMTREDVQACEIETAIRALAKREGK